MKTKFLLPIFIITLIGIFYSPQSPVAYIPKAEAGPATIFDGNSASSTAFSSQRKVVRTTNGSNGRRTFALIATTTNAAIGTGLFYTDDPDAGTPSWSYVGTISVVAGDNNGDMIWDETNNVLYIVYGKESSVDAATSDIFYRRVSGINGASCNNTASNCKIGAAQVTGLNATASISYSHPHITIGGDAGTSEIILVANKHTNCGPCGVAGWTVSSADLNSDAPTWDSLLQVKSWTASFNAGLLGITRVNTNKTTIFYYDGANVLASRHDDSADVESTSGWDALDGTDNSQTTVSADDPIGNFLGGAGSTVGLSNSDVIWFAWMDGSQDINTRRWSGSALGTELTPIASATSTLGPAIATDDTQLWLVYQDETDATKLVYQVRDASDGTTAWSGTEILLEDSGQNLSWPSVGARASTTLDVVYTTMTTNLARAVAATSTPTLLTGAATNVNGISATLNGQIMSIRGLTPTVSGFAYGTTSNLALTIATTTESGSFSPGMFSKNLSGLLSGVTYYYRAYATNSAGTAYGSIQSFVTTSSETPSRKIRLFNGYRLKISKDGKIIIRQQ